MKHVFNGFLIAGMMLLSIPAWAGSSSGYSVLTSSDDSEYLCPKGATSVTSSCYKLPAGLSTVAKYLSGDSSSSSSKSEDSSSKTILVSLSSGNASCPVSAFSMSSDGKSKLLDASKCSTSTSTSSPVAVCTSDASVSSTLLTCALPTKTSVNNPFQKFNNSCPGGGTREVTGGYDSKTGVLDATITLTGCKDKHGVQIDGTVVVQGTDVIGSDGSVSINDTKTINEKITLTSGKTVTRQCTIARVGTFTSSSKEFSGTITRNNCSLSGSLKMGGLIDFLADKGSIAVEETEGSSGVSSD